MKKVLIINSSFRKRNTYTILRKIEEKLKAEDFTTEVLELKDYKIEQCKGCEQCILNDSCPINDEMNILIDKFIQADGIVIGTPIYLNNMSGALKTIIDRTCKWFHRPVLIGKPVLVAVTTASSGVNNTLKSIDEALIQWGVDITGHIKRTLKTSNYDINYNEIQGFIEHLKSDRKSYKTTLKQIIIFNIEKVVATNILSNDMEYWKQKQWIDKDYYAEGKVSLPKKIFGRIFYKILSIKVKPINKNLVESGK
jgi:multimeric flavodoxin WrbA